MPTRVGFIVGRPQPFYSEFARDENMVLLAFLGPGLLSDDAAHANRWLRPAPRTPYSAEETRMLDVREYGGALHELHEKLSAESLLQLGKRHAADFANARPFPHIALDGIFPERYLKGLSEEFPEMSEQQMRRFATNYTNGCTLAGERAKCSITDEGSRVMRTPYARGIYSLMLSPDFVFFLEALTGIKGIVSDNSFTGSGFDQTLPGGSLGIHTDFHFNRYLKLYRRVNVFLYLNHDWKDEFGGHLELWSATEDSRGSPAPRPQAMKVKSAPLWNRLFVFATGDHTFHGHPMPLNTTRRNRRSVAMYYYTNGQPTHEMHEGQQVKLEQGTIGETCSAMPYHHQSTTFPACHEFEAVGQLRKGMNCLRARLKNGMSSGATREATRRTEVMRPRPAGARAKVASSGINGHSSNGSGGGSSGGGTAAAACSRIHDERRRRRCMGLER